MVVCAKTRTGRKSRIVPNFPGFQNLRHGQSRVKMSPGEVLAFLKYPPEISHFLVSFCQTLAKTISIPHQMR
ncbi:MAG: hypothetical protein EZS28_030884 [Streblomastix strix]|uniref:Uncharacterized protein n=1 Tax=Streblomastix strix TaxID=222440 RepID=A0A5J4UT73_9EUKA|nr:MAG: hypothetical protein EZS28_030884 [Streblomastix strix]